MHHFHQKYGGETLVMLWCCDANLKSWKYLKKPWLNASFAQMVEILHLPLLLLKKTQTPKSNFYFLILCKNSLPSNGNKMQCVNISGGILNRKM